MAEIIPTVTAYDLHEYRRQVEAVLPFAERIHIDLMDGIFAPTKSPDINKIWLPEGIVCDIHLMFQHPGRVIESLLKLNPSLIIIQAEADSMSVGEAIELIRKSDTKLGIALLADTRVYTARECLDRSDHALVFSGHLGHHGGKADLKLLDKVAEIHKSWPEIEVGWDGGISPDNAAELASGGVDALNTGAAIQKADDPLAAYNRLNDLVQTKHK